VTAGHEDDRIWNGADDDGSGTVAVMALARAFAEGRSRGARCSSSGTRAKSAACGDRGISPTIPAANAALPRPLALNYEFNDPSDLEQLYFRSDHYSYAAKGIPVIFFTTGLHTDYHANTE
jgi:Zn-dependent M28 family amino/carboxypeptidase